MAIVRTFFAVLAAVLTIVAVVAIKRGTEALLRTWPMPWVWFFDAAIVAAAFAAIAWTYLLRPRFDRRKQRE